jgi:hypothetical protein
MNALKCLKTKQTILRIEQIVEGCSITGMFWFAINWAILIAMLSFLAQRIIRKVVNFNSLSKNAILKWLLCSAIVDLFIMVGILILGFSLLQFQLASFEGLKELIRVSCLFSGGLILIRGVFILCIKLIDPVQN